MSCLSIASSILACKMLCGFCLGGVSDIDHTRGVVSFKKKGGDIGRESDRADVICTGDSNKYRGFVCFVVLVEKIGG